MGQILFVGNLSFDTRARDLETLFGGLGSCGSVAVISDRQTGRSRGFGFVEMIAEGDAARAVSLLNGRGFLGRALTVSYAHERNESGGRGGGPYGGLPS